MGAIENVLASQRPKAGAIADGLGDDIQWSNSPNSLSANWTPFVDNDDNLTYESAVALAAEINGNENHVLSLNGNGYVEMGNIDLDGEQDVDDITSFTISMWIYPEDIAFNSTQGLLSNGSDFSLDLRPADPQLGYPENVDVLVGFSVSQIMGENLLLVPIPLFNSEWYHIAAVYDGPAGYMKIYLNGEYLNQQLITHPGVLYDFGNFSFIGNGSNGQSKFVGKIDDLAIISNQSLWSNGKEHSQSI